MIIEKMKGQKGITIVSLVMTIIVILILAGITIGSLSSRTSILGATQTTSSAYKEESAREKLNLKISNLFMEKLGTATIDDVVSLKGKDEEITDAYKSGDKAIVVMDNYKFELNNNLSINNIEEYKEESQSANSPKAQLRQVRRIVSVDTFDRGEE